MSGIKNCNKELFFEVEKVLLDFGFEVFNPARNVDASWIDLIVYDLSQLKTCDIVLFLKGWDKSPGCQIEHIAAKRLGLPVLYANNLG